MKPSIFQNKNLKFILLNSIEETIWLLGTNYFGDHSTKYSIIIQFYFSFLDSYDVMVNGCEFNL